MNSLEEVEKLHKKQLRAQVIDLSQSLKINKELLKNVLMSTNMDTTIKETMQKLEQEVDRLQESLQNCNAEKDEMLETLKE